MEKENRVIYLHEPCKPNMELNCFYDDYKIPEKFRKKGFRDRVSFVFIPQKSTASIEYICPHCATHIKAEWAWISGMENRLKKSESKLGAPCKLLDYDSFGGYTIKQIGWDAPEYSLDDYEDALKYEEKFKKQISENIDKTKKETIKIAEIENCPICNAKLIKKFPYTSCKLPWSWENERGSIKWYKEFVESESSNLKGKIGSAREKARFEELEKVCVNPHLDKYSNYLQACDVEAIPKATKTNSTADFLKEYLMNLINLETNIICMSKRLKELYLLRGKNNRDVAYEQGFPIFNFAKEVEQKNTALLDLKQEKQDFEKQPLTFQTVKYPPKPTKPEMLKANIFNKKKIAVLNAQAEAEYQEAIKKHLIEVEECKKRTEKNKAEAENQKKTKIKKYSERIDKSSRDLAMAQHELNQRRANASDYPTPAAGKKYVIDTEIASLEEALKKNFQCRNELYSYNVIFEKYRNIVAVSSFYEYLMAGRCDSLEGVNGAYNIYENESRMDAIITKLDEIETKLDEIKANQFMIYNKLNSIESSLNSLNRTMEKAVSSLESINTNTATMSKYLENISNNTDVIAHNTAVSAYYSKVNAELTNALGFMVALN